MQTHILFVCMGNLCRSPLAEGVFRAKARARGVSDRFVVDSAGMTDAREGEPADPRMRRVAAEHGIMLDSRARGMVADDLEGFDHIICADRRNLRHVMELGAAPGQARLLRGDEEVPDPYWSDEAAFRAVFALVDEACDALLDELLANG